MTGAEPGAVCACGAWQYFAPAAGCPGGMVALSMRSRDSALMPLTTAAGSGLPRLSSGSGLLVRTAVSLAQSLVQGNDA